jgi:hypothetical protein
MELPNRFQGSALTRSRGQSGIRKKMTIMRSIAIMEVEKSKKGLLKRPFLLVPVQCIGYFLFFFFTFGASAAGAEAVFQLLRSCAIL